MTEDYRQPEVLPDVKTKTSGTSSDSERSGLLCGFDEWLRTVCFKKPTQEAYDLAKSAWLESAKMNNTEYAENQLIKASRNLGW